MNWLLKTLGVGKHVSVDDLPEWKVKLLARKYLASRVKKSPDLLGFECDECGYPATRKQYDAAKTLHFFCDKHWDEHMKILSEE